MAQGGYDGPERRVGKPDTGERRRWEDAMRYLAHIEERVEDVENELLALKALPTNVAELRGEFNGLVGRVNLLITRMDQRFDSVEGKADRATSLKAFAAYVGAVLVPILVALLGGYFALKANVGSPR